MTTPSSRVVAAHLRLRPWAHRSAPHEVAAVLPTYTDSKPKTASNAESAASDTPDEPTIGNSPGTVGTSPGEVAVCVVACGGGEGESLIGISPARAVTESTLARAMAVKNRFMDVSPLKVGDARILTSDENRATSRSSCKRALRQLISGLQLQAF